jgi:hypothetical protein
MEPSQAIESFKTQCDKYAMRFGDGGAVCITYLGGGWAKERFLFEASEDIDVLHTNSLMYPYEAKHQFLIIREFTDFHSNKSGAEGDSDFCQNARTRHIHKYRLDQGFWMPIQRKHQTVYTQEVASILGEASWYDCVEREGDEITFANKCSYGDE